MHPILFSIGSFNLYTYGLFVALGFITAIQVSKITGKKLGVSQETITDIFFIILVSSLTGARALYVLINFQEYRNNLSGIFQVWNGGLVFFGGFLGAAAALLVYFSRKKLDKWQMADIIAPGLALGHAVGRIGCLFAGCCYGRSCDLPFAIRFSDPHSLAPIDVLLHPTQVYSMISNLVIFAVLIWMSKRKKFNGMIFLSYMMIYSVFRSIIEFFRGDLRGHFIFEFLSLSQGIGIIVFISALILYVTLYRKSLSQSKA